MKKQIVTTIAVAGLAIGAFAQGTIDLANQVNGGYVLDNVGGNYSGPLTVQVWVLPNATLDGTVSHDFASATAAYTALTGASTFGAADVSILGSTVSGSDGVFSFGPQALPHVALGANADMALVMFNGLAWGQVGSLEGVVIFNNPTGGNGSPAALPAELTGWDALGGGTPPNLQLALVTAVPEPGTFALAGLGAAALLIFRRRK